MCSDACAAKLNKVDNTSLCSTGLYVQDLNPLPSAVAVANCTAWLAYAFVISDWYIWVENYLGLLSGLVLFLQMYGIGVPKLRQRDVLTGISLLLAMLLPVIGALERLVVEEHSVRRKLWGFTGDNRSGHLYKSGMPECLQQV